MRLGYKDILPNITTFQVSVSDLFAVIGNNANVYSRRSADCDKIRMSQLTDYNATLCKQFFIFFAITNKRGLSYARVFRYDSEHFYC